MPLHRLIHVAWEPGIHDLAKLGGLVMKKIIAVILIAGLGWAAWPYYALYDLATALENADPIAIEHRIAWDQVRQGLRDDLNAMFMEKMRNDASPKKSDHGAAFGTGLALVLGPAFIDRAIDAYITPPTIANVIRRGKLNNLNQMGRNTAATGNKDGWNWHQVRYAFFWGGPVSFKVEIVHDTAAPPLVLLFKWAGDWKLARLLLSETQGATSIDNLLPDGPESTILKRLKEPQKGEQVSFADNESAINPSTTPTPPKKPATSNKLGTKRVEALLDKNGATRVATASQGQATQFSSELEALHARLRQLWTPPAGARDPREMIVVVRIRLKPDGTLAEPPEVLSTGSSPHFIAARDSARRAVIRSQPFDMLRPEHYEQWKDMEITFDPRAL